MKFATSPVAKVVDIPELIRQCEDAAKSMSVNNPHRGLLLLAGACMAQLSHRLGQYEPPDPKAQPESPIIVPSHLKQ